MARSLFFEDLFFAALEMTGGNLARSAELANVSKQAIYLRRKNDPAFAARFDAALGAAKVVQLQALREKQPVPPVVTSGEPVRLVRPAELAKRLGVSAATVKSLAKRGDLPAPRRISRGIWGWPSTVVDSFLLDLGERA